MKTRINIKAAVNVVDLATIIQHFRDNDIPLTYAGCLNYAVQLACEHIGKQTGWVMDVFEAWRIIDQTIPLDQARQNLKRKRLKAW